MLALIFNLAPIAPVGVAVSTVDDEMPIPCTMNEYLGDLPYDDDDVDMDVGGNAGVGAGMDLGSNRSKNEGKPLFFLMNYC
jgi:hypothetical protein